MVSVWPCCPDTVLSQYFANDYYELAYNSSGHAFERGSGQPPHLAPQGVRCNHEGVGYSEHTRRLLASCGLKGPQALPDSDSRHNRDSMRMSRYLMQQRSTDLRRDDCRMKGPGIIFGSKSIAFIDVDGNIAKPKEASSNRSGQSGNSTARGTSNASRTNQRQLSNRYQWREDDPEELLLSDDAADEDYHGGGNRSSSRNVDGGSSDEELADHVDHGVDDDEGYTLRASRQRPRSRTRSRPSGSNSRGQRRRRRNREESPEETETALPSRQSSRQTSSRRRVYNELGSDDEGLNELMSTNTTPSGPFATDWTIRRHIFKMPRGAGESLDRGWLSRQNYPGSHLGKRAYCPQVGDSVVYIPRAHEDTLQEFPSIGVARPCNSWPTSSSWPAVRCEVLQVRHRFPYQRYKRKINTVSLIVSLRVTGIPKSNGSQLRPYPWPSPEFYSPATSGSLSEIQFEVTMFECDQEDFVMPCDLFCWRIRELERAIEASEGNIEGLRVALNYPPDPNDDEVDDDPLYDEFEASLLDIKDPPESELHMQDSGFNSILAKWVTEDGNDDPDETVFSVWQVHLLSPSCDAPVVPMLSSEEKVAVSSAYHAVTEMSDDVERLFNQMPDINTYTGNVFFLQLPDLFAALWAHPHSTIFHRLLGYDRVPDVPEFDSRKIEQRLLQQHVKCYCRLRSDLRERPEIQRGGKRHLRACATNAREVCVSCDIRLIHKSKSTPIQLESSFQITSIFSSSLLKILDICRTSFTSCCYHFPIEARFHAHIYDGLLAVILVVMIICSLALGTAVKTAIRFAGTAGQKEASFERLLASRTSSHFWQDLSRQIIFLLQTLAPQPLVVKFQHVTRISIHHV